MNGYSSTLSEYKIVRMSETARYAIGIGTVSRTSSIGFPAMYYTECNPNGIRVHIAKLKRRILSKVTF